MYFLPFLFSSRLMAFAHKHRETDFLLAPVLLNTLAIKYSKIAMKI